MVKHKIKITYDEIIIVMSCILDQAADFKDWEINRLNIYRLYSMHALERKFQGKILDYKSNYKLSFTIAEILTIRDVLSDYNNSPEVSGLYMKLDSLLPPQIR